MPSSRSSPVRQRVYTELTTSYDTTDTFVTPTGKNLPSLFSNFRDFFRLQGKRLKCRGRDWLMLMIFKWSSPKTTSFFRRDIKIRRSQTAPAAVALHKQMYTLFAEGDIPALRKICTDGLFESFHGRIASRARGEKVKWELVKYNKRTRVVSHRAARMPVDGMAVRQAVVRICSKQKLTRWRRGKDGKMEMVAGSGKEKDVVEYLVVQRMCRDWEEGDWRVWGTTGESTLEDVDMWERKALE
jgi:protein MBA1